MEQLNNFYQITNEPIKPRPSSYIQIEYQMQHQNKRISELDLIKKIEKLNINNEEEIDENNQFKSSVQRSLSLFSNRYFQPDLFKYCFKCSESGHNNRNCINEQKQICNYCLSDQHISRNCSQNICFKCHEIGHKKNECKLKGKQYQNLIKLQNTHISTLYQCLNCLEQGHINCKEYNEIN